MNRWSVLLAKAIVLLTAAGGGSLPAAAPPSGGTISIAPKTAGGEYDPATRAFADAMAAALAARGFTILDDPDHAAYAAELILSRADVGTSRERVPGQRTVQAVGVGVAVPLSTGKSDLVPLLRTRVDLRIRARGEQAVVWRAAAVTVRAAGARTGTDAAVAADLAGAMLRDYPAEPKDVVGVP